MPTYWDAIGGNRNDNVIFKNTVNGCMKSTSVRPILMICDAGADGHEANKLVLDYGIVPVIAARTNSVGEIIKTEEGDALGDIL